MLGIVLEAPLRRYPGAELADDGRWVVFAGPAEVVLPAGVERSDGGWLDDAIGLRSSVGDGFEHFRLLAVLPADRLAAHLLEHVRSHGVSPLCVHGLPPWHDRPPREQQPGAPAWSSCTLPRVPGSQRGGLRVAHAVAVARVLDDLLDAAVQVRRRQAIRRRLVHSITEAPYAFPAAAKLARGELDRDGRLSPWRSRQLISLSAEGFLRCGGARLGMSWIARRRPEPVAKVETAWAMYGVELARRIALDDAPTPTYTCSACAAPVRLPRPPRPGDRVYCQQRECQRERWRRNKTRQRHEKPAAASGREGNGA